MALWLLTPLAGRYTAIIFLLILALKTTVNAPRSKSIGCFLILCTIYITYQIGSGLYFGTLSETSKPVARNLPMLIVAALSYFFYGRGAGLNLMSIYRGCYTVIFIAFIFLLIEKFYFGVPRPKLFSGLSLDLTPTFLVPGIICSMRLPDLTSRDRILGLSGMFLAIFSVGGLCEARAAFVAFGVLVTVRFCITFLSPEPGAAKYRDATLAIAVALLAAIAVYFSGEDTERLANIYQFSQKGIESVSENSLEARYWMLKSGWTAFLEQPIFGYGPQNRFAAAAEYLPRGVEWNYNWNYKHLHNTFITHAVAGGIVAVILVTSLIAFPAYVSMKFRKINFNIFEIGIYVSLSFGLTGAFNNLLFSDVAAFNFAFTVVVFLMLADQSRRIILGVIGIPTKVLTDLAK